GGRVRRVAPDLQRGAAARGPWQRAAPTLSAKAVLRHESLHDEPEHLARVRHGQVDGPGRVLVTEQGAQRGWRLISVERVEIQVFGVKRDRAWQPIFARR